MSIGFVGIGHMGEPMAHNLLRAGIRLTVWNRTLEKSRRLVDAGATPASSSSELFKRCKTVLLMLRDNRAIDAVLGRGSPVFAARVRGRTIVHLGTTSPDYSRGLEADAIAAGGAYVEAPVSGSCGPAAQGTLIGMVAGHAVAVEHALPVLGHMCRQVFQCGPVPGALRMKLAVNHYLIGMVALLAETMHAAGKAKVDLDLLRQVLDMGPMASAVSREKLEKLALREFSPQAAVREVSTIADLVMDQCMEADIAAPLMQASAALFRDALASGHGDEDMAAVIHAFSTANH